MSANKIIPVINDYQSQHYVDTLRQNSNIKVEIYFDTEDVQNMIQGVRSIETNLKIDNEKFKENNILVHALAFHNQFDKIYMLPPHQDELANYINSNNHLPEVDDINYKELVDDLFHSVGLSKLWKQKDELSKIKISDLIDQFRDNAIQLYKANYFIKKTFWNDRIKYLINFDNQDNSILKLSNEQYNLDETLSTDIFKKLYEYFKKKRPSRRRTNANFRDAYALTIISNKLEDFVNKKTNTLPIFYTTTNTINLINQNTELIKLFSLSENDGSYSFSVLRGEMFFILDALFSLEDDPKYSKLFESFNDLKEKIGKSYENIVNNQDFEDEVNSILSSKFFISFWFENMVRDQISDTILELTNYDFILEGKSKNTIVKSERDNLTKKIKASLKQLEILKQTWNAFERIDRFIKKSINTNLEEFDVFVDFGLTRFSLLKCQEIQNIINKLIESNQEDENSQKYHLLKSEIIKILLHSLQDIQERTDDLIIPISVFWVFEEYKLIDDILSRLNLDYQNLYQLAIIHSASIAKRNVDTRKAVKILNCVISKYNKNTNYKPNIGIGFVYYQIWKNNQKPIMSKQSKDYSHEKDKEIIAAIKYNNLAYRWLSKNKDKTSIDQTKSNRNRKYYYCLNNKIYFETRSKKHFILDDYQSEISKLELSYNAGNGIYWQPRFAHTLALAYFRSAYSEENKNGIKPILITALKWINIAEETMPKSKTEYVKLRELIEYNIVE